MRILGKIFLTLLVASSLVGDENFIDSVGLNAGYSKIYTKQKNIVGAIELEDKLDEDFKHGEFYITLGLFDSKNYKATINYNCSLNDELKTRSFMIGVNRYFLYDGFDLYLGLLAGGGTTKWKLNPLHSTIENEYKSSSAVGAVQVGVEYNLTQHLLLGVGAKYYLHDYKTKLEPNNTAIAEISHPQSFSISAGIRYKFNSRF